MKKITFSKQNILLFVMILIGVVLLVFGGTIGNRLKETTAEVEESLPTVKEREAQLARELEDFLEQVQGISQVSVLVTLDSSDKTLYASDSDANGTRYVIVNSGGQNHLSQTHISYANVRGVAIICEGGELAQNQKTVISLLSTLFHIPQNNICVAGRK